jgi:hypothetical protein
VQQQALAVYHDMTLLAFDLLAGVVAMRVDRRPPCMRLPLSSVNGFDDRCPVCGFRAWAVA